MLVHPDTMFRDALDRHRRLLAESGRDVDAAPAVPAAPLVGAFRLLGGPRGARLRPARS